LKIVFYSLKPLLFQGIIKSGSTHQWKLKLPRTTLSFLLEGVYECGLIQSTLCDGFDRNVLKQNSFSMPDALLAMARWKKIEERFFSYF
jgi:hypothetical protein